MIHQLKRAYPVPQLCRVLDCPRSSYYDRPQERDEQSLVAIIEAILIKWPFYGYRRLRAQSRREGLTVGERVARRILRQLGVSHSVGNVRVRTTDSNHTHLCYPNRIKDLDITRPDQVWIADITYIRLGTRFIDLAVILDAYTRRCAVGI
jgi:putative transposase